MNSTKRQQPDDDIVAVLFSCGLLILMWGNQRNL